MNLIDRFAAAVSPKWAAKRAAWDLQRRKLQGYDVADPTNPRNEAWMGTPMSEQDILELQGDQLRQRARYLERNSDVVNAVINAIIRNVIGLGYQLQAQTPRERLNDQLEALWREWCKPRNCDATGALGFSGLLTMILRRKIVDGGVLIHKVYMRGGPCPFSLQVMDVDVLTEPLQAHRSDNVVRHGVELDISGIPVGYWVQPASPNDMVTFEPLFIEEKNMLFYFTRRFPSQTREVTDLAPILKRIHDADEFASHVSEKQKIEADFAVYIQRNVEAGFRGAFLDGSETRQDKRYSEIAPGMIFDLAPGESMGALNPTGQATDASSFMKLLLRLVAAGMGLSYEAVSRDMSGVNYSSARQSAIEDEVSFAPAVAQFMDVLHEIYETFVISCVRCGAVDIPDFWDRKTDYLAHSWVKVPKKWVDPKKEAEANILLLQAGLKSWPEAISEMGGDWKEALNTIAEVVKYGDKAGVDVGGLIYDGKLSGLEAGQAGETGQNGATEAAGDGEAADGGGTAAGKVGTADKKPGKNKPQSEGSD